VIVNTVRDDAPGVLERLSYERILEPSDIPAVGANGDPAPFDVLPSGPSMISKLSPSLPVLMARDVQH
jgi:hypothetical protein